MVEETVCSSQLLFPARCCRKRHDEFSIQQRLNALLEVL